MLHNASAAIDKTTVMMRLLRLAVGANALCSSTCQSVTKLHEGKGVPAQEHLGSLQHEDAGGTERSKRSKPQAAGGSHEHGIERDGLNLVT